MEDKNNTIPVELMKKVTGGKEEGVTVGSVPTRHTDGGLDDIPEKKKKKLNDLYGNGG